jgi:hypothetical protein
MYLNILFNKESDIQLNKSNQFCCIEKIFYVYYDSLQELLWASVNERFSGREQ